MVINNDYYKQIINDYPEYVTKEQFYKIAHISKKTAQYLLQSKKVPCVESNKKTRKYKIKTSDIVTYMIDREIRPGYYSPKCLETTNLSTTLPKSFLCRKVYKLTQDELSILQNYFIKELKDFNDLLTISEISELFNLPYDMISRRCTSGDIFSFLIKGKRLIPKICLSNFLSSPKGFLLIGKSTIYESLLLNYFY